MRGVLENIAQKLNIFVITIKQDEKTFPIYD